MKILIIMSGFFPGKKYGGPPVSVSNFCKLLPKHISYIVCHDHDLGEEERYRDVQTGWNKRGNSNILYLSDAQYCQSSFENVIQEINPDIIYLQGLFQSCIFPCLSLAKKYHIKVLLAPRGELCSGAFKKKYKKIPYIIILKLFGLFKNVFFQSTSDEETLDIQKHLGISEENIFKLPNIPSIPQEKYLRRNKIPNFANLVFISRIVPKKNLLKALELLQQVKGKVNFDIYGPIEDQNYWAKCQQQISNLPCNITINYRGLLDHNEIHKTFANYDAFFFPTLSENFGHVIAESLFVGTPVIISDQTPFSDVNDANAGWAIPLAMPSKFIEAIEELINTPCLDFKSSSALQYINLKLDIKQIKEKYNAAFMKILQK